MERETKSIKTESGHEIVYHTRMTAGEYMEFNDSELGDVTVKNKEKEGGITTTVNAKELTSRKRRALVDIMVVSVDGETNREKRWTIISDGLWSDEFISLQVILNQAVLGIKPEEAKK